MSDFMIDPQSVRTVNFDRGQCFRDFWLRSQETPGFLKNEGRSALEVIEMTSWVLCNGIIGNTLAGDYLILESMDLL